MLTLFQRTNLRDQLLQFGTVTKGQRQLTVRDDVIWGFDEYGHEQIVSCDVEPDWIERAIDWMSRQPPLDLLAPDDYVYT